MLMIKGKFEIFINAKTQVFLKIWFLRSFCALFALFRKLSAQHAVLQEKTSAALFSLAI